MNVMVMATWVLFLFSCSSRCPTEIGNMNTSTSLADGMCNQASDVGSLTKPQSDMQSATAPQRLRML